MVMTTERHADASAMTRSARRLPITRTATGAMSAPKTARRTSGRLRGGRLFSVYHDGSGVKFWIITEADRSATTVLLPDDY